ncbi:MAG: hypothetical protein ACE5FD_12645, partial [Anaerolineae bacterium]
SFHSNCKFYVSPFVQSPKNKTNRVILPENFSGGSEVTGLGQRAGDLFGYGLADQQGNGLAAPQGEKWFQ